MTARVISVWLLQFVFTNSVTHHFRQQGKYVLRDDCWCELDLYHPRWSPRELQLAEDRYLRACKAPAMFAQLPRWKEPFKQLQSLGRIIVSSRVHDMLRSVFFHAAFAENLSESRSPEGLLFSALHLLALALDVCAAYQNKMGVEVTVTGSLSQDLNTRSDGSSTPKDCHVEDIPQLLLGSVERVKVGREDGTMMEEQQSMLSILVTLFRKNSTADSLGTSDIGNYSVGGLIKTLLRRFADLNQSCMGELELLAPEVFQRTATAGATFWAGVSGDNNRKDDTLVSELDRTRAMARERQAAVMVRCCMPFVWSCRPFYLMLCIEMLLVSHAESIVDEILNIMDMIPHAFVICGYVI